MDHREYEKQRAIKWSQTMGIMPRKTDYGKAVWDTSFINNSGTKTNHKRLHKGRLNPAGLLRVNTTGIAITKKVVKESKPKTYKVWSQK